MAGRGPQVLLDGAAQAAARGAAGSSMRANVAAKILLEASGLVGDGNSVDGSSITGLAAEDFLLSGPQAWNLPYGTTTQRPTTGDIGQVRFNTSLTQYEFGYGGSWLPFTGSLTVNALSLGFVGDGVTDNAAAVTKLFARTDSPTVYFPAGVYMMGNPVGVSRDAASNISIQGAGRDKTILRISPSAALNTNLYRWYHRTGFSLRDFTIDLNGATAAGHLSIVFLRASTKFVVDHVAIIGTDGANMNLLAISADDPAFNIEDYWVTNCYFKLTVPQPGFGRAVTCVSSNSGIMQRGHIQNNVCINTGIGVDGGYNIVSGNDISGGYGAGLWTYPTWLNSVSGHNIITGNYIHDSTNDVLNSDGVPAGGIEWDSDYDILANNVFKNLGGSGVILFGRHSLIANNLIDGFGLGASASGTRGDYDQTGFRVPATPGLAHGSYNILVGNVVRDNGSGTGLYGYYEHSGDPTPGIVIKGNSLSGVTAPYVLANTTTVVDTADGASQTTNNINPTGTTSTTLLMAGLNVQLTPQNSGVVTVTISGSVRNSTATDGGRWQLRYGTGTPPTNAAAVAGTAVGTGAQFISATNSAVVPFTDSRQISGLLRGTTYWFDLAFSALTGGTCTLAAVDVSVRER